MKRVNSMFLIRSGEVEIERHGKVIETLPGSGGIFGEMALIDGLPRSATRPRQAQHCVVAPINEKIFLFLVHETPYFAIAVMRTLADRVRRSAP